VRRKGLFARDRSIGRNENEKFKAAPNSVKTKFKNL